MASFNCLMEKSGTIAKTKIIRGSEPTAGVQFIKQTMQSFRKLEKCACCWIIGMCGLLKYASGKKTSAVGPEVHEMFIFHRRMCMNTSDTFFGFVYENTSILDSMVPQINYI